MATKKSHTNEPVEVEAKVMNESGETKVSAKSSNGFKWFLIGCGGCVVLFICSCLICFLGFGALFNVAFKEVSSSLAQFDEFCDLSETDLASVYNTMFTDNFKRATSLAEFRVFYNENKDVFGNCDSKFSEITWDDFSKGFSFNVSKGTNETDVLQITIPSNGKLIYISAIIEGGDFKIDAMDVR